MNTKEKYEKIVDILSFNISYYEQFNKNHYDSIYYCYNSKISDITDNSIRIISIISYFCLESYSIELKINKKVENEISKIYLRIYDECVDYICRNSTDKDFIIFNKISKKIKNKVKNEKIKI